MVVLEGGGMLSNSGNQYLQPDFLPHPTTLDAKKSPLALLAQTCSQIGADSPSTKPLISSLEKTKKSSSSSHDSSNRSPPVHKTDPSTKLNPQRSTPTPHDKPVFKPYENNVVVKKTTDHSNNGHHQASDSRPGSKSSIHQQQLNLSMSDERKSSDSSSSSSSQSPDRKSMSPAAQQQAPQTPNPETGKTSPAHSNGRESRNKSASPSSQRGASPIIRSGLEMLQTHPKDAPLGTYKHQGLSMSQGLGNPLSSLCCPPGLEQHPAFRPPFAGAPFSPHHAAMLAASSYPGASPPQPYLSYARVKTPSGGEALVPVCKDPYCTSCQFSMHNQQQMMAGGPCPSGCTQCDHQKYNLAMAMSLMQPGSMGGSAALSYAQLGRPHVCSWIVGDTYCGKRFVSSEELLQHLRTHTSGPEAQSVAAAAAAAAAATTVASSLLSPHPLFSTVAGMHRSGYPTPPLSPLSAARYHPYGKPTMATSLAASPYSAFNPTALGQYYSPYSVYGQRLGAAAVHP